MKHFDFIWRVCKISGICIIIFILIVQGVFICRQESMISALLGNATLPGKLNHKLEIYIPATLDVSRDFDNHAVVELTLQELAETFGGSSARDIRGCWIGEDGKPVFEQTVICFVYCSEAQLNEGKKYFREFALKLRNLLRQEQIAIVIDDVMEFI